MEAHELEWTPEQIQIFWDHFSALEARGDRYFSRLYGRSLIAYVRSRIGIGTPLDYGCGRGDLLGYLAEAGCKEVHGVDQSPESRAAAARRIGQLAVARLGVTAEPNSADTTFMVEVIEHLNDEALGKAFGEVHRALRPGGHFVITTPNDENLDLSKVICPQCRAVFHTMQHVRSWTCESLSAYAENHGFQTTQIEATILSPHSGFVDRLWRGAKLSLGQRPNLIYIGRKA